MKNKRRILGIAVAILLAVVGTTSLVLYVQSAKDEAIADEELVEVYVVDEHVPMGATSETIEASVSVERVPTRLKQPGAVTDLDDLGDQVAGADLQPGDQLVAARLTMAEAVAADVTDKVQVSALLDAERAVGGTLRKGDLVGVYLSFDPFELDEAGQPEPVETTQPAAIATGEPSPTSDTSDVDADTTPDKTPNLTRLEFHHVLVTNVQTVNAPVTPAEDADGDDPTVIAQVTGTQYVVTLALSPEESERFVFAKEFGHVWLSIEPSTVDDDGTRPVTLGNVLAVVGS